MELKQAIDVINAAMQTRWGRYLSDVEVAIMRGAWQNQTYFEIADAYGYSTNYLTTTAGPKLWRQLSQALGEPVSKTNFRWALERHALSMTQSNPAQSFKLPSASHIDWGEAPDASHFCGRTEELNQLQHWILGVSPSEPQVQSNLQRCRLVTLLGMGGIGKTALAVKLVHQLQNQFEFVIWRSLRNAPSLEKLLADWILFLSQQQDTQADQSRLLHYLRSHRCLLILDNAETIFQEGDRAGHYRTGYGNYGDLFRVVGETAHVSCLVLTSREKPAEVVVLEDGVYVRSLSLQGSEEAAQALIAARNLSGSEEQKQALSNCYGNNPLAIKIVTSSIQDLFDGNIEQFLQQDTILFNGLRRLLEQQFERLSDLEQIVMYWLAINREWSVISELAEDILPAVSRAKLMEALESLAWRNLIEKRAGSYTQQPVVMEYVTDKLTERITVELITNDLDLLNQIALIKTTVKDYVRESQVRLILAAIADKLQSTLNTPTVLEQQFRQILHSIHHSTLRSGYAAGNLINLAIHQQLNLTGWDFSELTIRHPHLQTATLHQVNLTQATLLQAVFMQTFGAIFSVAFSPDGQQLAAGDANGMIRIWRVADGQELLRCEGHHNWVRVIAFSPDGSLLASASDDHTIKLWNPCTGECFKTLQGHQNWLNSLAFSPTGQLLVSSDDNLVTQVWNVPTGQCIWRWQEGGSLQSCAFSPDGTRLAIATAQHTIKLWQVSTWQLLGELPAHQDWINQLSFSPDGTILASSSFDGTVRLWDVKTRQPQSNPYFCTLKGHQDKVWSAVFSPDGQILATSSSDQTIRLWNVKTRQLLKTLHGQGTIWSVAFSPDSRILASGSHDQMIQLWDVNCVPDESTISGQCIRTLQGYSNQVWSIAFNPEGSLLVSGSYDKTVRVWDVRSGRCLKQLKGHTSWVRSVAFSPDGMTLASGSSDYTIKLWNRQTGQCTHTLSGHTSWLVSVVFSPDGKVLASASQDGTNRLWDVQTGQVIRIIPAQTSRIRNVAIAPDNSLLASHADGMRILLWRIETGELVKTLEGEHDHILRVEFSPDNTILATSGHGIHLWNIVTGQCFRQWEVHQSQIWSVAFSRNGRWLVSGGDDCTVRVWDLNSGKAVQALEGHQNVVHAAVFGADDRLIASGSADATIKIWNVQTGECLQTLRADRPYEGMNITGISGLTEAQKATFKVLGAIEAG